MYMAYVRCEANDYSHLWQDRDTELRTEEDLNFASKWKHVLVVTHAAGARLGERQDQGFRFGNQNDNSALC